MGYYIENNSWRLLKTWWLWKTCEESVAEVTWEEDIKWEEERIQDLALGKADINGKVRKGKGELDKEIGKMMGRDLKSVTSSGCSLCARYHAKFFTCIVLFKPHIHSLNTLVLSLHQVLF